MIGAREIIDSTVLVRLCLSLALGAAGAAVGCSTMKATRPGAGRATGRATERVTAANGGPGAPRGPGQGVAPREVARASLGPLSASKWRLDNGLTAVLMPDPPATSISYTTWFRVGSRDEDEAGGRDRPGPPVRAPDVHADQGAAGGRLRSHHRGGGRQRQRDDLLRLHRVRRRHPARRSWPGGAPRGRPHGEPGAGKAPGRAPSATSSPRSDWRRSRTASTGSSTS